MARNSELVNLPSPEISRALTYLRERDPILAQVIERTGAFSLEPEKDLFKSLVRAIIGQQISTSAARSIYQRLLTAVGGEQKLLSGLRQISHESFRAIGVSSQKQRYLRDLAEKVAVGTVRIHEVPKMTNEEAIAELTQVIGIGRWTVHMLLIFSLSRLDVFPGDDLGLRTAIKKLYRKRVLPKPKQLSKFEKLWQPYASVASWYCWRSLEFEN